jgi:ribosome-binding factor A
MKPRKASLRQLLSSCAEVGPDDGLDPRTAFRKPSGKVTNRKALQLCGQVARTLNLVLGGECADDLLRSVLVESVQPAPDSSRLLVTLCPAPSAETTDPATVLEHLHRAAGRLRAEVASAIHRKRAPELMFRVVTVEPPSR